MNIKNKIRSSWHNPKLPNDFLKKNELEFTKTKSFRISFPAYFISIASLIIAFVSIFVYANFKFKKNDLNETPIVNIDFGTLNPIELSIKANEVNKIHIKNVSYYNVRGNFALWFNNLDIKKSKVDYNTINLKTFVDGINPVRLGIANDEYTLFFTKHNYLVVCYSDKYIMYDLPNADLLLESFSSSF